MATEESLVEERESEMVIFSGEDHQLFKRVGHFIKPTSTCPKSTTSSAPRPVNSKPLTSWPPNAIFKGWRCPLRKWNKWVTKLELIYGDLWKKAGIFAAIKSSVYKIRSYPELVWGLLVYWCMETNTFVFPWGEATVTLEDVVVLGGLSLLGEPVRMAEPLAGDDEELHQKMIAEHKRLFQSPPKKAQHSTWMNWFMVDKEESNPIEHVAFLSLWLSRYVFPSYPGDIVGQQVHPLAIRLAKGERVAIAPAVLARIYHDLGVLKKNAVGNGIEKESPCVVWALFQIVQLWVWERFLSLRPKNGPRLLQGGQPRAARWHEMGTKTELSYVMSVLKSPDEFQSRPYAINLVDWVRHSFYKDVGEWISGRSVDDEELGSFARCLRPSELVGIDCIEQYLPHRVAMQFGLDQDVPAHVPRANSTWELAWTSYNRPMQTTKFYVPPRLFESDVTAQFYIWWKEHFSTSSDAQVDVSRPSEHEKNTKRLPENSLTAKRKCLLKSRNEDQTISRMPASSKTGTSTSRKRAPLAVAEKMHKKSKRKRIIALQDENIPLSKALGIKERSKVFGRNIVTTDMSPRTPRVKEKQKRAERVKKIWGRTDASNKEARAAASGVCFGDMTATEDPEVTNNAQNHTELVDVLVEEAEDNRTIIGSSAENPILLEDMVPIKHEERQDSLPVEAPLQISEIMSQLCSITAKLADLASKFN